MFKMQFDTNNAAFESKENEITWILSKVSRKLEEEGAINGAILDSNGNKIGFWELTED